MENKKTKGKESLRHNLNDIIRTTDIEKLKKVFLSMTLENSSIGPIATKEQRRDSHITH
jgi:hypothetical protein